MPGQKRTQTAIDRKGVSRDKPRSYQITARRTLVARIALTISPGSAHCSSPEAARVYDPCAHPGLLFKKSCQTSLSLLSGQLDPHSFDKLIHKMLHKTNTHLPGGVSRRSIGESGSSCVSMSRKYWGAVQSDVTTCACIATHRRIFCALFEPGGWGRIRSTGAGLRFLGYWLSGQCHPGREGARSASACGASRHLLRTPECSRTFETP
jgi:hypothetical protein